MTSVAGCLFAYYRGFVSVEAFALFLSIQYVAMIIIGGMGSLLGALLGAAFVTLFPYAIEALLHASAERAELRRRYFRGELRRLRRGDDPVPGLRAARARRHLAPAAELFSALAVQVPAAGGSAQMSEPLLQVEKIEVVYQARRSPPCRASRCRSAPKQIVALLGTNGAGKTTTLRAISGFLGLDDARVTEGTIVVQGTADREPRRRTTSRARGIVLVPERDKVFPNLTVAENLAAPVRAPVRRNARRQDAQIYQFFPRLAELRQRDRRPALGRRAADAGDRRRADVPAAAACWSTSCRSGLRRSSCRI